LAENGNQPQLKWSWPGLRRCRGVQFAHVDSLNSAFDTSLFGHSGPELRSKFLFSDFPRLHLSILMRLFRQLEQGSACADLDVVRVSAKTENAPH
jgi:hypothetical protein